MPHRHMQFDNSLKRIGWGWRQYIWRDVASIKITMCGYVTDLVQIMKHQSLVKYILKFVWQPQWHWTQLITPTLTLFLWQKSTIMCWYGKTTEDLVPANLSFSQESCPWAGLSSHKSSHRWRWEEFFSPNQSIQMGGLTLGVRYLMFKINIIDIDHQYLYQ